ncbi:MAG: hypothetical protein WD025_05795, partial [Bacteriovoracaceae bacterium]
KTAFFFSLTLLPLLVTVTATVTVTGARAEYRVYQYIVVNKVPIQDQPKTSLVVSSLDPVSYISYHGGNSLINVDLLRTWICPGHTGKKRFCQSPYARLPKEILQ